MGAVWFAIGVIVVSVGYMIWDGTKNQREWSKNFRKAKKKVADLGFKLSAYGDYALIKEGEVLLAFQDDNKDVVTEQLASFEIIPFGDQITLFVHKSGNVAFMTTNKGIKVSSFVFEK